MRKMYNKNSLAVLVFNCLALVLLSSSTLLAQQKAEEVKPMVRPNVQTVNPTIRTELIKPQPLLSPSEHQAIIRAHEARVQAQVRRPTAQAVTTLSIPTQNHQFRGEYDCDDENREVYPGAQEICDGFDNNCDGDIDENVSNRYFLDADGDSWGDASRTLLACDRPDGYASRPNDCDDTNIAIYPGAADPPGNGVDENCNGSDG